MMYCPPPWGVTPKATPLGRELTSSYLCGTCTGTVTHRQCPTWDSFMPQKQYLEEASWTHIGVISTWSACCWQACCQQSCLNAVLGSNRCPAGRLCNGRAICKLLIAIELKASFGHLLQFEVGDSNSAESHAKLVQVMVSGQLVCAHSGSLPDQCVQACSPGAMQHVICSG